MCLEKYMAIMTTLYRTGGFSYSFSLRRFLRNKKQQTSNYFWQLGPLFLSKRHRAEGVGVDEITLADVIEINITMYSMWLCRKVKKRRGKVVL